MIELLSLYLHKALLTRGNELFRVDQDVALTLVDTVGEYHKVDKIGLFGGRNEREND